MTDRSVKSPAKPKKFSELSSPNHSFTRETSFGPSHAVHDAAAFPQRPGNLAVQHLFRTGAIQAKLAISRPGDPDEEEADRVADQVMRMAEPTSIRSAPGAIQRKCSACEAGGATCPKCEEGEKIRRKENPGHTPQATLPIHSQIGALRGGGHALPLSVRAFFEPRFGRDFSSVRAHTDTSAAEMNSALQAKAFTHKQDVYYAAGKVPSADHLTAHELTHVAQQTEGIRRQSEASTNDTTKETTGGSLDWVVSKLGSVGKTLSGTAGEAVDWTGPFKVSLRRSPRFGEQLGG